MNIEELQFENIKLRNELANKQAKINRFLKFLAMYENDMPKLTKDNTILELNLVDNLKEIIREAKKMKEEK